MRMGAWMGGHKSQQAFLEPRTLRERPSSSSFSAFRAVSDMSQDVHVQLVASAVRVIRAQSG